MSMSKKNNLRRSGAKTMASLILLLGSLAYIMVLDPIHSNIRTEQQPAALFLYYKKLYYWNHQLCTR